MISNSRCQLRITGRMLIVFSLVTGGFFVGPVRPCTIFQLHQDKTTYIGETFDYTCDLPLAVVNKQNVLKQAIITEKGATPVIWTSKYGSLTFNTGVGFSIGGMNEAGLFVGLLAQFPKPELPPGDDRPVVGDPQWVQYNLDNCIDVQEVIRTTNDIRLSHLIKPPHFFTCDRDGNVAVIEFIGGKTVVHTGSPLVVPILTNYTYDRCLEYLREHRGFGGDKGLSESLVSDDRFVRTALLLKDHVSVEPNMLRNYAFSVLKQVSRGKRTRHSIVWDLTGRKVFYRNYGDPGIKMIDFTRLEFSDGKIWQMMNLLLNENGDVTDKFIPYNAKKNRQALTAFHESLNKCPSEITELMVAYPERTLIANGVTLVQTPQVTH